MGIIQAHPYSCVSDVFSPGMMLADCNYISIERLRFFVSFNGRIPMNAETTNSIASCWILTDGKVGMVNQCRGLAEVLGVEPVGVGVVQLFAVVERLDDKRPSQYPLG